MVKYNLIQSSRSQQIGGGAAMFIHKSLNFHVRGDLMPSSDDYESVHWNHREDACNLIVGNVYRAPGIQSGNILHHFDLCLNAISKEGKLCYLMGNFNLDFLRCSDHRPADAFVNTFYSYGFRPLIDQPTRITTTSSTLIDNILTNNDSFCFPIF